MKKTLLLIAMGLFVLVGVTSTASACPGSKKPCATCLESKNAVKKPCTKCLHAKKPCAKCAAKKAAAKTKKPCVKCLESEHKFKAKQRQKLFFNE